MRTRPIATALVLGFLAVALLATAPTASAEGAEWPDYVEYRVDHEPQPEPPAPAPAPAAPSPAPSPAPTPSPRPPAAPSPSPSYTPPPAPSPAPEPVVAPEPEPQPPAPITITVRYTPAGGWDDKRSDFPIDSPAGKWWMDSLGSGRFPTTPVPIGSTIIDVAKLTSPPSKSPNIIKKAASIVRRISLFKLLSTLF